VEELELPSTPLKATEARASRWREVMGHEQTEIDALAALNPNALIDIVREAIRPYYDATLSERTAEAEEDWRDECDAVLAMEPAYANFRAKIETELTELEGRRQKLLALQDQAVALLTELEPPDIELPLGEPDEPTCEPLFCSKARFAEATMRLRQYKNLTSLEED